MQPRTDSNSVVVGIAEANTPPTGTDNSFAILETDVHVFQAADFGFFDAEDGTALTEVQVSVPSSGEGRCSSMS
jgi:hypothetical protein